MTLLRPDWIQETWDMFYGREDALRGGITPEEYERFLALEAPVRAAAGVGSRLRLAEEHARRQAAWQDEQDERDRLAEEHAARTAHLLDCWPGLTRTRTVPNCAGVYIIRHVPSGREYVGQSCQIRSRWSQHLGELRRKPYGRHPARGDWEADGPQAFEWEIVEVVGEPEPPERLSPDELRLELLSAERRWIEERRPAYNRSALYLMVIDRIGVCSNVNGQSNLVRLTNVGAGVAMNVRGVVFGPEPTMPQGMPPAIHSLSAAAPMPPGQPLPVVAKRGFSGLKVQGTDSFVPG